MRAPELAVAYPDWLDRTAYPFATRYFPQPAGRMHLLDEGQGPPVVMVHGNPTWSFLYRHLVHRQLKASVRGGSIDRYAPATS